MVDVSHHEPGSIHPEVFDNRRYVIDTAADQMSWWARFKWRVRCEWELGHCWHPSDGMIEYKCCECPAITDGMPRNRCKRCTFTVLE